MKNRTNHHHLLPAFVFIATVCVLTGGVDATLIGTVDLAFEGTAATKPVKVEIDIDGDSNYDDKASGPAGTYEFSLTNPTGQASNVLGSSNLFGFCIEPDQTASSHSKLYEVRSLDDGPVGTSWRTGPIGTGRADLLRELWGRFFDTSWTDGHYPGAEKTAAAGFNMAVWELAYETAVDGSGLVLDATAGTFRHENNGSRQYADIANSYLGQLTGDVSQFADLFILTNADRQDYVVPGNPDNPVPEPTTVGLLLLGSGMLLHRGRRRQVATVRKRK